MPALSIAARDPGSRARAGILRPPTATVRTPAFVPLATKATVKGLLPAEVADLGYDMVLGNTFHLFLDPGHELIAASAACTASWAGTGRSSPTPAASRSSRWATGPWPTRSRAARRWGPTRRAACSPSRRSGVRFRSYLDGSERFMGPETSMEIQAALGSDLALVFDECTPFHVAREYTARSTERTHRWLRRCLDWHAAHGPDDQLVYGIVQGGVHEDLRVASAQDVAASEVDGVAIGGSLGADKAEMHEVVGWTTAVLAGERPSRATCSGSATSTTSSAGSSWGSTPSTARCRRAWAATAWRSSPTRAPLARRPQPARLKDADEPIFEGCPCPACARASPAATCATSSTPASSPACGC